VAGKKKAMSKQGNTSKQYLKTLGASNHTEKERQDIMIITATEI
jgi:hypothetical protein